MHLPSYAGFHMIVAKNPGQHRRWETCKEYAGRTLGSRNPKHYVTITIWTGYKPFNTLDYFPRADDRAKELEDYLNTIGKEWQTKDRVRVFPIKDYPGCLHIRVPPAWCDNRVTAHLFYTYIRKFFGITLKDNEHLSLAKNMLDWGKKEGMDKFNEKMRELLSQYRLLGICAARYRWTSQS